MGEKSGLIDSIYQKFLKLKLKTTTTQAIKSTKTDIVHCSIFLPFSYDLSTIYLQFTYNLPTVCCLMINYKYHLPVKDQNLSSIPGNFDVHPCLATICLLLPTHNLPTITNLQFAYLQFGHNLPAICLRSLFINTVHIH